MSQMKKLFSDTLIGKITIYIFVDPPKKLNRTLPIDLPFQTFAVGLIVDL